MEIIKEYPYKNWIDFLDQVGESSDSIFRGQSNTHQIEDNWQKPEWSRWPIKSNFQRESREYQFLTFGFHESNSLKHFSHLYNIEPFKSLPKDLSIIEFLEVLQHYGFKTPLIDFTTDLLTALYFAAINLSAHQVGHNPYRSESHVSIFELNIKVLNEKIGVDDASHSILANSWTALENKAFYRELINTRESGEPFIYTVNHPNKEINENVKLQNGRFVLFDSLNGVTFEQWIIQQVQERSIYLDEPIIKIHNISHDGIFMNEPPECINLFAYLMHKERLGINLFADDLQGMKLDINNESAIHTLKCVDDKSNCDCLANLRKKKLDV